MFLVLNEIDHQRLSQFIIYTCIKPCRKKFSYETERNCSISNSEAYEGNDDEEERNPLILETDAVNVSDVESQTRHGQSHCYSRDYQQKSSSCFLNQ